MKQQNESDKTSKRQASWQVMNVSEVEGESKSMGIYGGAMAALGAQVSSKHLGFNITTIAPGKFLCPYHSHHLEEELALVLEGEVTVRQDGETRVLGKNELIFFATGVAHQMYNHSESPVRLLVISNKDAADVCEYPDSNKILFRKLGKMYQQGSEVGYFHDEEEKASFWRENSSL